MIDDRERLDAISSQIASIAERISEVADTVITRDEFTERLDRLERMLHNVVKHLPGLES